MQYRLYRRLSRGTVRGRRIVQIAVSRSGII
jgi:hypothetical protein